MGGGGGGGLGGGGGARGGLLCGLQGGALGPAWAERWLSGAQDCSGRCLPAGLPPAPPYTPTRHHHPHSPPNLYRLCLCACVQIYMGVSIGNAAWPIGVTQVGLHERSAREKIRLGASSAVVCASFLSPN